jgi:CHAD domain-containing protein
MAQAWAVKGLDPEKDVASCLKRILRTRAQEVLSYQTAAVKQGNVDALHDMRVSVRRLMTLLKVFRPYFARKPVKKKTDELKTLLASLGCVRDRDVFIGMLVQYRSSLDDPLRPALDAIIAHEEHARSSDRKQLKKMMSVFTKKKFMDMFDAFLAASLKRGGKHNPVGQPPVSFRESALIHVPALCDAFFVQRTAVVGHPRAKKKLHAMRIDGKRARYGMEIFSDVFGSHFGHCLDEIKSLVDILGTIHDYDVYVPVLTQRVNEIRFDNAHRRERSERLRTEGLARLIKALHARRAALFGEITASLLKWERENFADAVTCSMKAQHT